jgi:hypothetical protein
VGISVGVHVFQQFLSSVVIGHLFQLAHQQFHVFVAPVGLEGSEHVLVLLEDQFSQQLVAVLFGVLDQEAHVVLDALLALLPRRALFSTQATRELDLVHFVLEILPEKFEGFGVLLEHLRFEFSGLFFGDEAFEFDL